MHPISDIWDEHKARLRAYVVRRVPEPDVVNDILQEVFIKAYENLHSLRVRGSVAPWLYRIASNVIADHYRSQKPWTELPEELTALERERDPVEELASCLQPLIDDLPETYRLALKLSEIEGLSQKEVATRLGLSYSGAKSRIQRGRDQLRQRLHDCCVIETGQNGIIDYEPRQKECNGRCS
ncbi:RNA polymerase sigma factor SigZ [Sedimenticola sp.]|uniref:RNA polymerase sigma factor SigZ n=1 Tax=Sedimenticola sp. TaxID=1940285 RepID=UPI002584C371|nr:RNA polymerase sigma factor SigZ [Sedimenticola sp.]MCW8903757.1 RNA polymerase sigma factor SigZ [Sedimenticola sp.]